jgi:hypothetical protein
MITDAELAAVLLLLDPSTDYSKSLSFTEKELKEALSNIKKTA